MKYAIYATDPGQILRVVDVPFSPGSQCTEGESFTPLTGDEADETHYISGGTAVPFPPRPSVFHAWNWSVLAWQPDVDSARAARKVSVNAERIRRSTAVLAHTSRNLDGDVTAQTNLAAKIAEMDNRIALAMTTPSELLVWRDADNVTHAWGSVPEYRDWLAGFAVALAERGTRMYMAAWQHKAAIDALSTVEDILAYDITTGWPA